MMLIGYRMLFGELCTLLNVHIDPDADYVEDDNARETLISSILKSVQNADLCVLALTHDIYYLGLSVETCSKEFQPIMTTRDLTERTVQCSIQFRRELKKVGLFKHLNCRGMQSPDPVIIQCDRIYPITA
jgi:hypothetical protein